MTLYVEGRIEAVREREAGRAPDTWTEHTLVVASWGRQDYVTAAKALVEGGLPSVGDEVRIEVGVRAYVGKDQRAGWGLTGFRWEQASAKSGRVAAVS